MIFMIHQDRDGCFLKLKSKIEKPSSYLNSAPKKHMAIIAIIITCKFNYYRSGCSKYLTAGAIDMSCLFKYEV